MTNGMLITLGSVIVLILLDALLGIILSIKARNFNVRELPKFLGTNLLPYIGGLLVLALAGYLIGDYSTEVLAIFYAAVLATQVKFLAEIKDKVVQIFGEIEIPTANETFVNNIAVKNDTDIDNIADKIIEVLQKQITISK